MNVTSHILALGLLAATGLTAWEGIVRPRLLRPVAELRHVLEIAAARRENRREIAKREAAFDKLRAEVRGIGTARMDENGGLVMGPGWSFDCSNGTPVHRTDREGVYRYCGYSVHELIEISTRQNEFAPSREG